VAADPAVLNTKVSCRHLLTIIAMFEDYNEWIQLQKSAGGLPANLMGYAAMVLVSFIAHTDLRNPATVLPSVTNTGKYLEPESIPARSHRPQMYKWSVPQRQSSDHPSDTEKAAMKERLESFLERHKENGTVITLGKALDSLEAYLIDKHELFHIHPVDRSFHVSLDPKDSKLLIEKGWAEWFGLTGKVGQKEGVVFVYAASDRAELDVLEQIWEASVKFAEAGKRV
jgi:hypothetical protein